MLAQNNTKTDSRAYQTQILAYLCITSAQQTIVNLPPIDFIVKAEPRIRAYRFQLNDNWNPHPDEHLTYNNHGE